MTLFDPDPPEPGDEPVPDDDLPCRAIGCRSPYEAHLVTRADRMHRDRMADG